MSLNTELLLAGQQMQKLQPPKRECCLGPCGHAAMQLCIHCTQVMQDAELSLGSDLDA